MASDDVLFSPGSNRSELLSYSKHFIFKENCDAKYLTFYCRVVWLLIDSDLKQNESEFNLLAQRVAKAEHKHVAGLSCQIFH